MDVVDLVAAVVAVLEEDVGTDVVVVAAMVIETAADGVAAVAVVRAVLDQAAAVQEIGAVVWRDV